MKKTFLAVMLSAMGFVYAKTPQVISSIYPLQQIANEVVGESTGLITNSYLSPHGYAIRPSKADDIMNADIVLWVGDVMMPQLGKYIQRRQGTTITAARLPNIALLPATNEHSHQYYSRDKSELSYDPHLWLSIDNAAVIASALADALIEKDPANEEQYRNNAALFKQKLEENRSLIMKSFEAGPVPEYFVFHDAYRYFEKDFGIEKAGVIRLHAGQSPKTRHLSELRKRLAKSKNACLFREPQFRSPIVKRLTAGTSVKVLVLDPIGYKKNQTGGYNAILLNLATQIARCNKK